MKRECLHPNEIPPDDGKVPLSARQDTIITATFLTVIIGLVLFGTHWMTYEIARSTGYNDHSRFIRDLEQYERDVRQR